MGDGLDASRHRCAAGLIVWDRNEGDIFDGSVLAKVDTPNQSEARTISRISRGRLRKPEGDFGALDLSSC